LVQEKNCAPDRPVTRGSFWHGHPVVGRPAWAGAANALGSETKGRSRLFLGHSKARPCWSEHRCPRSRRWPMGTAEVEFWLSPLAHWPPARESI